MKVKMVSPTEQWRYIYSNSGNLLSNVKVTGSKPSMHNIYLGSTVMAEVERNMTDPSLQVAIDSNSTIYGYGYGDNNHKHQVKGYFDLSQVGGEIKVCVDGYGINSATEVSVTINGHNPGVFRIRRYSNAIMLQSAERPVNCWTKYCELYSKQSG